MYRIFCESYINFLESMNNTGYRYEISKPFSLIVDVNKFNIEKKKESNLYKKLCDLIYYMKQNVDKYPKVKAFLWTLDSRNIKGKKYNITKKDDLEEETKLVNSFLKLAYWY